MSRRPSAHLSWAELACRDGTPYPERWRTTRAVKLAAVFEAFRYAAGCSIKVECGYRTMVRNRTVGGVQKSQHVEGRALDLHTPPGWTRQRFHQLARDISRTDQRIGAIGYYRWGVHVDTRPRGRKIVAWGSTTAKIRA